MCEPLIGQCWAWRMTPLSISTSTSTPSTQSSSMLRTMLAPSMKPWLLGPLYTARSLPGTEICRWLLWNWSLICPLYLHALLCCNCLSLLAPVYLTKLLMVLHCSVTLSYRCMILFHLSFKTIVITVTIYFIHPGRKLKKLKTTEKHLLNMIPMK